MEPAVPCTVDCRWQWNAFQNTLLCDGYHIIINRYVRAGFGGISNTTFVCHPPQSNYESTSQSRLEIHSFIHSFIHSSHAHVECVRVVRLTEDTDRLL